MAEECRTAAGGNRRGGLVTELEEEIDWLSERAVDAPENFSHLVRLLEAERAWAVRRLVDRRPRPSTRRFARSPDADGHGIGH